jgi:two-component system copper resistance phosphate regulon response regulator CusR
MPVLVLTARSDLDSKVENFQAGADDYVVKPVAMAELSIRVQALLRRGPALQENVLRAADLEVNRLTRQVKRDGQRIELSPKEYSLLEYLFLHAGRVLSRSMIVEKIWDQSFEGLTNIVDVYIGHLRRKIDEGHDQKLIRTVRGLGYTLDVDQRK